MEPANSLSPLLRDLRKNIRGEVRFDPVSRVLYSTDASIYEIEPLGVVLPRTREDLVSVVQICAEHNVPLIPRGGGTNQTGACLGRAVILDCSKYLNTILEVNREEMTAQVEPGVVVDDLNAHLRPQGLMFAVDVSPANRANIGGMCGTNAGGTRSLVFGKMIDNVTALDAVLADGSVIHAAELPAAQFQSKLAQTDLEGNAYRELSRLAHEHQPEIETRYPHIQRRVGGYNLDEFVKPQPFNLKNILIGSEGTLAVTREATVKLVPRPRHTALAILHFQTLRAALEATTEVLPLDPSAVEVTDRFLLDMTRRQLEFARLMTFLEGDPEAVLYVEFFGNSESEVRGRLEALESKKLGYTTVPLLDPQAQANAWKVRKASVGLLLGIRDARKPTAFVEDTAVPPERLAAYIDRFDEIVRAHGTTAAYYAHASVGLLHIRPLIDLKSASDVVRMRSIMTDVTDLVLEFGGAISGEHGDGLLRSEFNEKFFGPELYNAFRELKRAFDPRGLLNPNKITDAPRLDENLRYARGYQTLPVKTHFDFSREGGFTEAIEMCNGNAECRKRLTGTMCPSYMVTMEEKHSTRGRANVLRAAMSGRLPDGLSSSEVFDALDLCLECKGCKAECPSNVDMAKLKYEFLAQYQDLHGIPIRSRLFANIATLNALGSAFAPISNWVIRANLTRLILDRTLRIDSRRTLPRFERESFAQWFRKHRRTSETHFETTARSVVLFNDTFVNYNYPEIGRAAVKVLERLGYRVILAEKKCCGRPMISKGLVEQARRNARWNVNALSPYAEQGIPIIGLEPSCLLTLRDEYPDLVDDPRARTLSQNAFLIDEFLAKETDRIREWRLELGASEILFHGHCHQKALVGSAPSLRVLRSIPGLSVTEVDSGCCGMAGAFGYEKEHYEVSVAIGERRLIPAVKQAPDAQIVADGVSCRQQLLHTTGRHAIHLVELLAKTRED